MLLVILRIHLASWLILPINQDAHTGIRLMSGLIEAKSCHLQRNGDSSLSMTTVHKKICFIYLFCKFFLIKRPNVFQTFPAINMSCVSPCLKELLNLK